MAASCTVRPAAPGAQPGGGGPLGQVLAPPSGTYAIYVAADGRATRYEFGGEGGSPPRLPADIPLSTPAHPELITVDSDAGSSLQYRVLRKVSDTGMGTMTIAIPLTDVSQTLTRLRNIELIVIAAVLLALAAFAWLLIRIGLRPLDRMGATAGAIAGGRIRPSRVSPADERSEVGRLGLALNAMLDRLEAAFDERDRQ